MKFVYTLVLSTIVLALQAQDRRDYQWIMGVDQQVGPEFKSYMFDFNNRPITPELRDKGLGFDQNNVSISDREGRLLFYSNGCAIANRDHEIMENGEGINAGEFFDDFWFGGSCAIGYPGFQDILILEDPAIEKGYYVIHKRFERKNENSFDILNLTYSYVDLSVNSGLGVVVEKNIDFHTLESFLSSYLTAINKPNGEDWWVVNPGLDNKYYFFSIDNEGLQFSHTCDTDHLFNDRYSSAGGNAKFSPDGKYYAYFSEFDGLLLYNFDRELGTLSDLRKLPVKVDDNVSFATCEWSSDSRFLYLATSDSLWQVEVAYDNLEDGRVFIAEHNGVLDPISTRFFTSTLGPDCRIYIRPGSSTNSFHVINHPNEKGVACDLVQQGIRLPVTSEVGSFPNFPRFRVDEEDKCDPSLVSAFGEVVYYRRDLITYPNPVRDNLTIELPEGIGDGHIYVLDMQGQMVHSQEVSVLKGSLQMSMAQLPVGMYSVEYVPRENKERVVYTNRVTRVD